MESDTESIMERAERLFPNLVNCIGRLDTYTRKCNECSGIYPCYLIKPDLEMLAFAPGRYRPGFGKMAVSTKNVRW